MGFLLDDESGTATEDEEDVRARELRKQEVWLKMPPRSSDTDTGSETEVKHSQDSIDPAIVQESLISFESKITSSSISNMNVNDNELPFDRNTFGGLLSSNETIVSNELAMSIHDQDNTTSAHNNDASFNIILEVSENVICATSSIPLPMPNNTDDNISDQNESLIFLTNIAVNNHLDKEDCSSEYESFVDESIRLDLGGSDNKIDDCLQNDILDVDVKNLTPNSINFNVNVNDLCTNNLVKNLLDLSTNNLEGDFLENNCLEIDSEEVAKVTVADTIPCIETSKDSSKVSDSETTLNADDLPSVISSSLNGSKSSLPSSLEICRSVEMLHNGNSAISYHLDLDLVEYSKSNLPEEIEILKCENINITNQSEGSDFINKNRNFKFTDDSNDIHVSNVTKKVDIHSIPTIVTATVLQESIYPTVTVTSPSPTQEIQLEELSLETSRLLVPLESHSIPNFGNCDNAFDKLKHDLKQRKAKNKAIGNGLRPLSTEYARLKMSKYFTENKKMMTKSRPTQSEKAEDTSMEVVKLHIKPKLSSKVDAEEMLKYFNKTSSSVSNKSKTSNIIAIKQNEGQKFEIDIEEISDVDEKDIDMIDQQFNQIEEQNKIAYSEADEMDSQFCLLGFEIHNEEETACDSLDLICNDLIESNLQLNVDSDHVDPFTSNCNILKLENNNRNISYLYADTHIDTDLNINNLKMHTTIVSDISTLHTENNIYFNITNNGKEQEKIRNILKHSTENVLKNDINKNSTNKEKKVNVNLNSNEIDGDMIKRDNVIKMDIKSNILNNIINEEKRVNLMDLGTILNTNSDEKQANKINIPSDNMDKNNKNLLFGNNISLNAKSIAPSLLNNNMDKVIECNRLHKSDTNLNESTSRIFGKSTSNNSKSLPELKNIICKDVSAVKATIVEKIVDTSTNITDTITNNNSAQNYVEEASKRPERRNLSHNVDLCQKAPIAFLNLTISNTELSPEIPVRKKSAKRSFKHLCRNQAAEDMPKLQSQTVENISELYGQNSNNVSNSQNQDVEKLSKVKSQDVKVAKLISQDINNVPKIHCQDIQNHDTSSMDIRRPSRRNVAKLQNQDITNLSNLNNEIIKDVKDIIVENRNVASTSGLQNQNKSILSQKTYHHTNLHLPNKPEESIKFISSSSQSKKDKCIIS